MFSDRGSSGKIIGLSNLQATVRATDCDLPGMFVKLVFLDRITMDMLKIILGVSVVLIWATGLNAESTIPADHAARMAAGLELFNQFLCEVTFAHP